MKQKNTFTNKHIEWFDQNILAIITGILLIFIPLYPKLPLFDLIEGYIVRVRVEDFLILFASFVWVIQYIRGKAKIHPVMTKLIGIYLLIGLLSSLSAMYITKTVPTDFIHVAKLFLHYFRRIEYFAVFFIAYSAIKNRHQFKSLIYSLIGTVMAVAVYGFGQKFWYWPVYSTMNREFAKGIRLYLTEHARVPSTFGGHYDAAAYIMVVITIILALVLVTKKTWLKVSGVIAYIMGFSLLMLTASRTSFIAYLAAISALMFFFIFIKSFWWSLGRWVVLMSLSVLVMLSFGDLSERYAQVLGLDKFTDKIASIQFIPRIEKPDDYLTLEDLFDEETAKVASKTDQQPTTQKPGSERPTNISGQPLPADVYEETPHKVAELDEYGEPTGRTIEKPRDYSENAYKYGLSIAIRLDALWPRAIAGFMSNPLLGSGYSTLTKESVGHFTEAESTDNDFLRALGETGLLGFISFFAIVVYAVFMSLGHVRVSDSMLVKAYLVGFSAATVGLLLNAIYIDVFVSSKVVTVYWMLTALALASISFNKSNTVIANPAMDKQIPISINKDIKSSSPIKKKTKPTKKKRSR